MKEEFTDSVFRYLYRDDYPYSVKHPRTKNWFSNDWREISSWCNDTLGVNNWEYFHEHFCFRNKQDLLWFKLRWS